ncbi:2-C-methyl-D-erythritol 4-phosphate cytidylyltransferase [Marinomonas transparens]|uniref:2-C-methyl-D-erythritol 4-phosphate cytidylyltransferase n=1 Tax=Marinomonas transparens TaxID=2795388 RepID=A0A934JS21_9GAMM|nr:2-C-methyl-D-erythritol 4-phosphate cytidylyltransferase [Marinomonas transparens]MBJ7539653.1 2-C-methyl-D-erythritol 4-phosphate cytidylyltransferase [Marinomonas transparens]
MTQPLWVIIPAAGVGQRMQADCPKQYLSLAGQTILDRTIGLFVEHPLIAGVAVGLGAEDAYWPDSKWYGHANILTYVGGEERSDTVQKGLAFLLATQQIGRQEVLVHDAARPLLSKDALVRIVNYPSEQGAILAMPARETVKRQNASELSGGGLQVAQTLDRNAIWLAQTPQKFPAQALLEALEKAQRQGITITDECSAMEFIGWQPDLVMGENRNIKVTLPEDLVIAEALFSHFFH